MKNMGSYYSGTGNPTLFRPMSAYANTGNPTQFRPMSQNGYSTPMNIGEGGMRPMGVFPLVGWGVIAGLGALGILGATYVADTAVDNITTDPGVATAIGQPVIQASNNLFNTVLIIGGIYFLFRKDIQKALR
jgi:Flp pilus assembly pilin Flp